MPNEVLLHLIPVPFVVGMVLLAAWRWRSRAWTAALALGAAYATGHVAIQGWPEGWPKSADDLVLPFAIGALLLGLFEGANTWPLWVKLLLRFAASAGAVWQMLGKLAVPSQPWNSSASWWVWHGGLAAGFWLWWNVLDWRAHALRGFLLPVALWMCASAAAVALVWAHSAKLSEMAAVFAAALGAFGVIGAINRQQRLDSGAAGVFVLGLGGLLLCGYLFADVFPAKTALLLAVAPLLTSRRWWLTLLLVAILLAAALWFAHAANPPSEWGY